MTQTMFDVRLSEAKSRVFEFDLPKNEHVQVCSMFKKWSWVSSISNLVKGVWAQLPKVEHVRVCLMFGN